MREIKFRAWHKEEKRMVESIQSIKTILCKELDGLNRDYILMQYTGLKDAEGNEIYEGDIVVIDSPYYRKFRGEVIYDTKYGAFFAKGKDLNAILQWHVPIKYVKVIGNKWENPELLKEE